MEERSTTISGKEKGGKTGNKDQPQEKRTTPPQSPSQTNSPSSGTLVEGGALRATTASSIYGISKDGEKIARPRNWIPTKDHLNLFLRSHLPHHLRGCWANRLAAFLNCEDAHFPARWISFGKEFEINMTLAYRWLFIAKSSLEKNLRSNGFNRVFANEFRDDNIRRYLFPTSKTILASHHHRHTGTSTIPTEPRSEWPPVLEPLTQPQAQSQATTAMSATGAQEQLHTQQDLPSISMGLMGQVPFHLCGPRNPIPIQPINTEDVAGEALPETPHATLAERPGTEITLPSKRPLSEDAKSDQGKLIFVSSTPFAASPGASAQSTPAKYAKANSTDEFFTRHLLEELDSFPSPKGGTQSDEDTAEETTEDTQRHAQSQLQYQLRFQSQPQSQPSLHFQSQLQLQSQPQPQPQPYMSIPNMLHPPRTEPPIQRSLPIHPDISAAHLSLPPIMAQIFDEESTSSEYSDSDNAHHNHSRRSDV